MEEIALVRPNIDHKSAAEAYIREHISFGEEGLHGGALMETIPFEDWLAMLADNRNENTVRSGWVQSSTFFAVRESDKKIIGMIDIRHTLNDFLKDYGGHIGFGVRPTERGKGYAVQLLQQGLEYCRTVGLNKVMLECYKDNPASCKTIMKCGGSPEKEFVYSDGKTVQAFWIAL